MGHLNGRNSPFFIQVRPQESRYSLPGIGCGLYSGITEKIRDYRENQICTNQEAVNPCLAISLTIYRGHLGLSARSPAIISKRQNSFMAVSCQSLTRNYPLSKTQKGVDKRGLSPNPVEHKRREKKGFGRESLATQKNPSFGQSVCKPRETLSKAKSRQIPPNPVTSRHIPPNPAIRIPHRIPKGLQFRKGRLP